MGLILLVDMDSFFAACEQLRHSELKGKAFVVGTSEEASRDKGVVQTASYEARKFGIHSAMSFAAALKLKPDIIYIPSDPRFYGETSERIASLIREYGLKMAAMSIDEISIDSGTDDYEKALRLAESVKESIRQKIGLPCTIGVSTSTVYAKMVCDTFKPNRVGMVRREELKGFLADKEVGAIPGVGGKKKERLNRMGITKISELAAARPTLLVETFGGFGAQLSRIAKGEDDTGVVEKGEAISIGRETTLERETDDIKIISKVMAELTKEAMEELGKRKLWYRNVAAKVRYPDFTIRTKAKRLGNYADSYEVALNTSLTLIKELLAKGKARKVGIRLSELSEKAGQKSL